MATLTLYKATTAYFDSYSGSNYDLTSTSWYLFSDTQKVVYGALYGNSLTYDANKYPVLGTITAVSSFDKQGDLQWTLSDIAVASNSVSSLKTILSEGQPFDRYRYMVSTFLSSNDSILGSSGSDIIAISDGVDTIDGGKGSDWLDFSGRGYNGLLTVDLVVGQYSNIYNGVKTTHGSFSNIENVTGTSGDDTIIGDNNNNLFSNSRGNDVINGGGGIDTVSYTNVNNVDANLINVSVNLAKSTATHSNQYVFLNSYTDTLINIENIIGSTGNDTLIGDSFNNQFTGDLGNDTLEGGEGIDTVIFSNAYRAVTVNLTAGSATGQGIDKLTNIENIVGSNYNDVLTGSNAINLIKANAGNDSLNGRLGNDILTGGLGQDKFIFNTAIKANIDKITDFSVVNDTVQLENAIFTQLTSTGVINSGYFKIAKVAADSNDYLVYDKTTGALFYDADGNGAQIAVQIATVGVNLALTTADFVVS
ncbi:putative calcium-binding protein [Crenothrix polyspora]|uniref:Putative calcium-binding protein n=1 Tax=Crenothrix polyspora TaxID=360316 RepID=A0A1R4HDK6_9GAMM|nr:calcium-binding protein [Crenothrix polyspora]SJM94303.1 putative calcium-binding protein [Crenothrix polyspora]